MSDFGTARYSPGTPAVPLGKEHDLPGNTTIVCPNGCGWRVRVMDKIVGYTEAVHVLYDCPKR